MLSVDVNKDSIRPERSTHFEDSRNRIPVQMQVRVAYRVMPCGRALLPKQKKVDRMIPSRGDTKSHSDIGLPQPGATRGHTHRQSSTPCASLACLTGCTAGTVRRGGRAWI